MGWILSSCLPQSTCSPTKAPSSSWPHLHWVLSILYKFPNVWINGECKQSWNKMQSHGACQLPVSCFPGGEGEGSRVCHLSAGESGRLRWYSLEPSRWFCEGFPDKGVFPCQCMAGTQQPRPGGSERWDDAMCKDRPPEAKLSPLKSQLCPL